MKVTLQHPGHIPVGVGTTTPTPNRVRGHQLMHTEVEVRRFYNQGNLLVTEFPNGESREWDPQVQIIETRSSEA